MDRAFKKPYFDTKKEGIFPYTREQLSLRPIYPTLVMDGGAYHFLKQNFGVNNSDELLDIVMDGSLFKFYENDGVFSWKAVLERFRKTEFLQEWEAHIWLARMYILLPLAQKYMMTGDKKYSDAWYKIFRDFKASNPSYPFDPKVHRFNTDMVWSDMQMVWRMINLIFSVYMLSAKPECFSEDEWCDIHEFIRLHTSLIYEETVYHSKMKDAQNHNLQMACSMILAGTMYPEFDNAESFVTMGRSVVQDNLDLGVFEDGVDYEDSISYFPFIARLYVESQLLLTQNGYEGLRDTHKIDLQYEFIYQFCDVKGNTPQIGDSYRFNAVEDIEFVKTVYPLDISTEKTSALFPAGRMAVLRNGELEVFVDAMDMSCWHQHYGRMNFEFLKGGNMIVCDSGCTNYDRSDIRDYVNSAQAHNTLSLDSGLCPHETLEVLKCELEGDVKTLKISSVTDSYRHIRTFMLYQNKLEILDEVEGCEKMTLNLHLPPRVIGYPTPDAKNQPIMQDSTLFTQRMGQTLIRVKTSSPFVREFAPCTNEEALSDWCYALRIAAKGGVYKTEIYFE